jgi:hypothetical protein
MSKQLVQLIKSLSRNEKRYINLNLKTFSFDQDSNKFLLDFNKIEKQIGLKKKKNELLIEGNSTRLYYKIIDILYHFHEQDLPNTDSSLKYLKRAKLLIYKGFYIDALKLLNKIIYQADTYDYLIKMESLELKLNSAIKFVDINYLKTDYPKDKEIFSRFNSEYYNLMEFESMEALIKLESTTLYFYSDDHNITKTYRQLLENESNAFHPLAKIYFNKANAFLSLKRGELDKALKYAQRTIELFAQFPEIKNKNLISYLKSIRNLCIVLIHLNNYDEAIELLNKYEPELVHYNKYDTADVRTELFTLLTLLQMDIIISNQMISENAAKLKYFEKEFSSKAELLRDDEKASSNLNLLIINLHLQNYRQSLRHTLQALKISGGVRKDIFHLALMAEITNHYFLGNTDVLFSKLAAYKRLISRGELMFGFEKELPALLTTIFNNPQNSAPFKKLFAKINQSLTEEGKEVYKRFIPLLYLKPA